MKHVCEKNNFIIIRTLIVGPSLLVFGWNLSSIEKSKTFSVRDLLVVSRSEEQYFDEFEIAERTGETNDYEVGIEAFDDMSDYEKRAIDPLLTRSHLQNIRCFLFMSILL